MEAAHSIEIWTLFENSVSVYVVIQAKADPSVKYG